PERACMNAICARCQRRYRVRDCKSTITVPMPVHANLLTRRPNTLIDYKPHQRVRAHRCGMSRRITNYNRPRPPAYRCRIEPLYHHGIAPARILSDVHHFEPQRCRKLDSLLSRLQQKIFGPSLGVSSNRARTNKRCRLDLQSCPLDDFRDWTNVILVRARRAVRTNLHMASHNLSRQRFYMLNSSRPGARKTEIERVDPQIFHQMKNLDFLFDRRIAHRRRLQPVAQRFVIQEDWLGR